MAYLAMRTPFVLSLVCAAATLLGGCGSGTEPSSGGESPAGRQKSTKPAKPAGNRKTKKIGAMRRFSSLSDKGIVRLKSITRDDGVVSGPDVKSTEQDRPGAEIHYTDALGKPLTGWRI